MAKNNQEKIGQIFIELTNRCNFDCLFCPNSSMTRGFEFMDVRLAKKLIDEIAGEGISRRVAFFLMGEPLLHPNIYDILEYAAEKRLKITLSTNGSLLSEINTKRLLDIPLDILQLSVQTITPESFQLRRPAGLIFNKYCDNIRKLIQMKNRNTNNNTKLCILIMDTGFSLIQLFLSGGSKFKKIPNYRVLKRQIESIEEFLPDTAKRDLSANIGDNIKRFVFGGYVKRLPGNIEVWFGQAHGWGGLMDSKDKNIRLAGFGSCNALEDQLAILCNGDYSLCCKDYNGELVIGNAKSESIIELLDSAKVKEIRRDFRLCRLKFKRCKLCRGSDNVIELMLRQVSSGIIYNSSFFLNCLRRLALN